ncbi:MAG: helix-turn-helix transcriptional regulator [Firmicutes bacterium]|nr:helix-turn-helix transcriptional regulator [Bacillota bacterium]
MDFNEYLKNSLEEDDELKREYDALQTEYELIEKLIKARVEANLTQKELAQKCGMKQSNISRLESGKSNPTIRFLKKLANSLDCDLVIELRKREHKVNMY